MVTIFDSILEKDKIAKQLLKWNIFFENLSANDSIALVYNSDIDGIIGAVYAINAMNSRVILENIYPYQIGTEEYDFIELKEWIDKNHFTKSVFVDVSIENSPDVLQHIQKSINSLVFVYDHHIVRADILPNEKIFIANPTPSKLEKGELPVPTFLFALYLSQKYDIEFPAWLLLTAIFAEGVESFFSTQVEELYCSVFQQHIKGKNHRKAFRNTSLSRISSLVRAGLSVREEGSAIIKAFSINNSSIGYVELIKFLDNAYSKKAKALSYEITTNVDEQIALIKARKLNDKIIIIKVNSYPSVVGPIASILRQYFPDKVFLSYFHNQNNVMFEIRVDNNSPINLVKILDLLSSQVLFYNYGGHTMAAGGLLKTEDLQIFLDIFKAFIEKGVEL